MVVVVVEVVDVVVHCIRVVTWSRMSLVMINASSDTQVFAIRILLLISFFFLLP